MKSRRTKGGCVPRVGLRGALALALLGCVPVVRAAKDSRPNLVLILADDVGREAVGCYGGVSYPTPNVDRLAREGLRFDHFYSAPVCHPTRITLLSGRYPVHFGRPGWGTFPRALERDTLARRLRMAGYATAVAGKWQLTKLGQDLEQPHRMGFDTYCLFGWHEGPRYHRPFIWQDGRRRRDVADAYGPDVYTDFLVEFMRRNRERPFFAFYSMALCHAVSDDFEPPPPYGPHGRYETFAEMMAEMDRRVGRVVKAVDELGLRERTLVLFLTDNGSPRSNFLRHQAGRKFESERVVSRCAGREVPGGKGSLSDWGIRVPAIARWPERIPAGGVTPAFMDLSDVLPSFCALADAPLPRSRLDGRSFAALLRGDLTADPGRTWIYSEMKGKSCLRTRQWKLTNAGRLYRVGDDPFAERLMAEGEDTAQTAAVRRRLQARLAALEAGE